MHVRARRTLQDTLTAIRVKRPLAECGYALHPNGERHLRSRARLASIYPPALLAETVAIARRCTFSLDELRYEYPEEIVPPGHTPASHLRQAHRRRAGEAVWAGRLPSRRARADRARARADRGARLRAVFPHRSRHRRVRALAGDSLPGPRLGGQLGRLLRARHHRSRPLADEHAVRAVHLEGAQRAARHRRRLRAPAARGSDAVRLRQIRPRPRGARRDAHHLPAEERRARCRPRARPRPRANRPALRHVRLVGRPRSQGRTDPRGGARARQSGARPSHHADGRADGLPAPPVAACRRVRHRARPRRADGAGRERGHGRPDRPAVGQGRSRCAGLAQGRLPRARHALGDQALPRHGVAVAGIARSPCRTSPPKTPRSTRCASAPTPSACSRSSRARSSRCCRGSNRRASTIS